jgi:streptogramin lyase
VLASNFETDTVTELREGEAVRHTVAPGPLGLVDLGDGRSVLVLDYYSNAISRLDLATGAARTAPLADARRGYANPTHGALAPGGRIAWVVSSGTEGHLLAVDPETLAVERAVPIDGLSFDVLAVPGPPPPADP